MTRRLRMILMMILAMMLCVVFSMPSLAFEADNIPQEAEPSEDTVTATTPEPTVTVSPPVEIAVIPDEDWGNVGPELLAATVSPAAAEEAAESVETETEEPAVQAEQPADESAVPESTEPAGTAPETAPEEVPAAEMPEEETAEEPETVPEGQPAEEIPAEEPDADEPAVAITAEEEPDGEEPADPETVPETEKARVTVTVEISMIDETVMRLFAVVNDPEGRDFLYQWQVSEDNGMTYTDIPEANQDELKVELTEENINDMWRVRVQAI